MMAKLKLICLHKSINEIKAAIQLTMEYFYHINYEYTLGNSVTYRTLHPVEVPFNIGLVGDYNKVLCGYRKGIQ